MLPFYLRDPDPTEYKRSPFFVLDFETTNIEFGDSRVPENRIVVAALQREGHEPEIVDHAKLARVLPKKGVLVAHNAKFELGWLLRCGVDISEYLVWDTMIAEYVIYGNRRVPLDLGSVCERWGLTGKERVIDGLMKGGVCPSQMPARLLRERVLRDVRSSSMLFMRQIRYMEPRGLLPAMFTRCITTPVLTHIERKGMTLDRDRVMAEVEKAKLARAEAERGMEEMAEGRNLRSRQQLGDFLYGVLKFEEPRNKWGHVQRTGSGQPKTDKGTIASLKATTPEQKRFVQLQQQFAKADAALSKSLLFFEDVVTHGDGTFTGNFNQCRTKTHRLSSTARKRKCADGKSRGVQFQNMARDYKRLFRSRKGRIMEADGAGLEFRIGVDLGRDPQGRKDILDPEHDPHTYTATVLHRVAKDDVTKQMRTAAKSRTFKPLFSEGKTGTPREVAYYQEFKRRYAYITQTQEKWVADVLRSGELRLPSGMIAYWNLTVEPSGYIKDSNKVRNLPIQSFATADIIPVSLVYAFWKARFAVDADFVNTVHDSIVADVAEKDVDKLRMIVVTSFLDDTYAYLEKVYGHTMFVPLGVGITVGTHWGEGEEESYSYEQGDRTGLEAVREVVPQQDVVELQARE